MALAYRRALLKISGEAFAGTRGAGGGIDFSVIDQLGDELKHVAGVGVHRVVRGDQLGDVHKVARGGGLPSTRIGHSAILA